MRGEKHATFPTISPTLGSPPHARGKEVLDTMDGWARRITPACAGKSKAAFEWYKPLQDHPRMRGEKANMRSSSSIEQGSPPHARGKVSGLIGVLLGVWITPACAGKRILRK